MRLRRWDLVMRRHSMNWEKNREWEKEPGEIVKHCWTKRGAEHHAYYRYERQSAMRSILRGEDATVWFERPRPEVEKYVRGA